ncbi:tyrosine-type recombinase/integrase [Actinoallomurus vinaceus]|uniref:Tyrosine-type recombinase/integrase n=1 Tax=Actinoallomurus vinaceus TaxID=1080074 RepID=A0ABP8U9B0_9ACTN
MPATLTPLVGPPPGFYLGGEPEISPVHTYIDGLDSAGSRRTMNQALGRVGSLMATLVEGEPAPPPSHYAWWSLRFDHTQELRTALRECETPTCDPWAPSTVNKHLVALRQVLRSCMRHGLMPAEDYIRASDVKPVTGYREPVGRAIPNEDVAKLLQKCLKDHSPAGVRDAAIVALMHSTGLRRSEVVGTRRSSYDAAARTLQIVGKRNKQRTVYVNARAASWVNAWLIHVPAGNGPLFCPVHWSGSIQHRHMTGEAIGEILTRRCTEAGIARILAHDFRKTFISNFLAMGGDLVLAQRQAGHSDVSTTARYDRRGDLLLQQAVEDLWFPLPGELQSLQPTSATGLVAHGEMTDLG